MMKKKRKKNSDGEKFVFNSNIKIKFFFQLNYFQKL